MERTIVQLTPVQREKLRKRAKEQRVSVAELIRRAVDASLAVPDTDEELRRRALSIGGLFNSGTGDVSEKHNEYYTDSVIEH